MAENDDIEGWTIPSFENEYLNKISEDDRIQSLPKLLRANATLVVRTREAEYLEIKHEIERQLSAAKNTYENTVENYLARMKMFFFRLMTEMKDSIEKKEGFCVEVETSWVVNGSIRNRILVETWRERNPGESDALDIFVKEVKKKRGKIPEVRMIAINNLCHLQIHFDF